MIVAHHPDGASHPTETLEEAEKVTDLDPDHPRDGDLVMITGEDARRLRGRLDRRRTTPQGDRRRQQPSQIARVWLGRSLDPLHTLLLAVSTTDKNLVVIRNGLSSLLEPEMRAQPETMADRMEKHLNHLRDLVAIEMVSITDHRPPDRRAVSAKLNNHHPLDLQHLYAEPLVLLPQDLVVPLVDSSHRPGISPVLQHGDEVVV